MPRTIQHAAHREHPLVLCAFGRGTGTGTGTGTDHHHFECNGCGCAGVGRRCGCGACGFHLHELCATAPAAAWFFDHGQHPLALGLAADDDDLRYCDICDTDIRGVHYRCRPCGFDVHPVCSQLPGAAVSPLHLVTLSVGAPDECPRCGADCVWRYLCSVCGVCVHPKCLLGTDQTPLNIPKSD